MRAWHRGFSLIEIAVVLLIVALLLGGIVKAREAFTQVKINRVANDFVRISAAYHEYRDRYNAVPGDDAKAAARWTTPSPAIAGNGDGIVAGTYNSNTLADESVSWWDHLRRSGLIPSDGGPAQPSNSFGGILGVQTGSGAAHPGTALGGLRSLILCGTNLPGVVAAGLDERLDDGKIGTGRIRGQVQSGGSTAIDASAASAEYEQSGEKLYTVCREI